MITDEKSLKLSEKIMSLMTEDYTVGQFLDALAWSQSLILSQLPTHSGVREMADNIREKVIANTTFIKASNGN